MGRRYRSSPSYAPVRKRSSSSSSSSSSSQRRKKRKRRRKSDSSDSGKARKRRHKSSKRRDARRSHDKKGRKNTRRKNKPNDSGSEKSTEKKKSGGIKLFVGRLPREATEQQLRSLFGNFGEVQELFVMNQAAVGFAFVRLATLEQAHRAIQELDDKPAPAQALYTPLQVTLAKGESQRLGLEETSLEARKQELQHFALSAGLLPVRDLIDLIKGGVRSSSGFKQKWMNFCEWSESQGVKTTNPSKHPAVALSTFVGTVAMEFGNESWFRNKFKHLPFASAPGPPGGLHPLPQVLRPHTMLPHMRAPPGVQHMPPMSHNGPGWPPAWNPSGMPRPPSNIFRPGGPAPSQGGSIFRPWGPPPGLTGGPPMITPHVRSSGNSDPDEVDEYSDDSESEDVRPVSKNVKVSGQGRAAGVASGSMLVPSSQEPSDVDALSEDTEIEAVTI